MSFRFSIFGLIMVDHPRFLDEICLRVKSLLRWRSREPILLTLTRHLLLSGIIVLFLK
jgi:hypothetical protein